jgi:hypothetical protein
VSVRLSSATASDQRERAPWRSCCGRGDGGDRGAAAAVAVVRVPPESEGEVGGEHDAAAVAAGGRRRRRRWQRRRRRLRPTTRSAAVVTKCQKKKERVRQKLPDFTATTVHLSFFFSIYPLANRDVLISCMVISSSQIEDRLVTGWPAGRVVDQLDWT